MIVKISNISQRIVGVCIPA